MSIDDSKVSITHHPVGKGGKYIAEIEGEKHHGYLEWEPGGEDVRVAAHTVVPRAIGGRGIAGLLVERLVADAREEGFRIVRQCSYVSKKFDENPEWADLKA